MDFVTHVTILAGVGVLAVQQLLKMAPVALTDFANKWPVPTNIVLSVVAALFANYQDFVQPQAWTDWVALVALVSATAAVIYNMLVKQWMEVRALETTAAERKANS